VESLSKIDVAAQKLREGEIVAYPTETFYGLGVDAHNSLAISKLATLKGRPENQPFPLLLPTAGDLSQYATNLTPQIERLIERYWPGPLTIIVKAQKLPGALCGASGGIGFRVSAHPLAAEMAQSFGRCITTTSSNVSGQSPATTATEVLRQFSKEKGYVFEGGPTPGGYPSTVIDLTDPGHPSLVRQGAISWEEILKQWPI
jgi:L-threonylcarbamoyladenylate synthase